MQLIRIPSCTLLINIELQECSCENLKWVNTLSEFLYIQIAFNSQILDSCMSIHLEFSPPGVQIWNTILVYLPADLSTWIQNLNWYLIDSSCVAHLGRYTYSYFVCACACVATLERLIDTCNISSVLVFCM